jgi:ActR/RegA family two-component response regulator
MKEKMQQLVAELVAKEIPIEVAMREFEAVFLREVVSMNGGNISATSKQLGMHRNTLSKKVRQHPHRMSCHNETSYT